MKFTSFLKETGGFSLIETAISLIVFGILTGLGLSLLSSYQYRQQLSTTRENQEILLESLAGYLVATGTLPCPGDPYAAESNFGKARETCPDALSATGIIPFKTLGLPETHAKDGYKNFYLYVVSPNLTKITQTAGLIHTDQGTLFHSLSLSPPPAPHKNQLLTHYCLQKDSPLRLLNKVGGDSPLDEGAQKATKDFIALLLISFGPEGKGAYKKAKKGPLTLEEHENLNDDFVFVDRPYSKETFPHLVKWVTKNHFLTHYARLSPCEGSTAVSLTPGGI